MTIVRDGVVHELTHTEMYDAYRACKRALLIEDIKEKAIEMEIDLDDEDIDVIADRADRAIDNNDYLWESYWRDIEYALENRKVDYMWSR